MYKSVKFQPECWKFSINFKLKLRMTLIVQHDEKLFSPLYKVEYKSPISTIICFDFDPLQRES